MTPDESSALFDPWTRDYAHLGLRLDRLAPGTVDAWIGPPAWRAAVAAEPPPAPTALHAAAAHLLETLPGMGYGAARTAYLARQVTALEAQARVLAGEAIPFAEQARRYFDIEPAREPEATFAAAHAALDALLPGSGPLLERRAAWHRRFQAPAAQVAPLLPAVVAAVRARTLPHIALPAGEAVEIRLTHDQPWAAYNWYLGGARSLIEINTDLPIQADRLVDLLAHEGYPGHHTEHALREAEQFQEQGLGEYAIQIINTPESLLSEAIATSARELIFPGDSDLVWLAGAVFPALGLDADPAQAERIRAAEHALAAVRGNAAFLLHEDGRPAGEVAAYIAHWSLRRPEEADHALKFLQSPLWRVYTFTYYYGHRLLQPLLAGPDRFAVFRALCTSSVYPALLHEGKLPTSLA